MTYEETIEVIWESWYISTTDGELTQQELLTLAEITINDIEKAREDFGKPARRPRVQRV